MHTLYFIPGLGADQRLFSKLQLSGYEKKYIRWVPILKKEALPDYARRLSEQITSKEDFSIIGVSFGGMLAVEMAKFLHPENIILISTAKTCNEIPWTLKFFKYLPLYRLFSDGFIRWLSVLNKRRFGIFKEEEKRLFGDMMFACPAGYFQGAIRMILYWQNQEVPSAVLHIHGEKDYLFPIHKIKDPVRIKGGTHFMPYHNAEEVEKVILEKLKK